MTLHVILCIYQQKNSCVTMCHLALQCQFCLTCFPTLANVPLPYVHYQFLCPIPWPSNTYFALYIFSITVTNPYPDARRGFSIVPGIGTSVGSEEGVRVVYTRVFEVQAQGNRARPAGSRWRQTTWARPESRVRRRAGGEV